MTPENLRALAPGRAVRLPGDIFGAGRKLWIAQDVFGIIVSVDAAGFVVRWGQPGNCTDERFQWNDPRLAELIRELAVC